MTNLVIFGILSQDIGWYWPRLRLGQYQMISTSATPRLISVAILTSASPRSISTDINLGFASVDISRYPVRRMPNMTRLAIPTSALGGYKLISHTHRWMLEFSVTICKPLEYALHVTAALQDPLRGSVCLGFSGVVLHCCHLADCQQVHSFVRWSILFWYQ